MTSWPEQPKTRLGFLRHVPGLKNFVYVRSDGTRTDATTTMPGGSDDATTFTVSLRRARERSYENPIVCAVVNWIIEQASTSPLELTRTTEDGEDVEVITEHPLLDRLERPSEFMSGDELQAVTISDMLHWGQAFWRKVRERSGQITALSFLPAGCVRVYGAGDTGVNSDDPTRITHYTYQPKGRPPVRYEVDEIVHIRLRPNPRDPKNGESPLDCVAAELLADNQSGNFTSHSLANGGAPGGFLTPPGDIILTEEVVEATADYVKQEFSGNKRGEIGVLRARMEFVKTVLSPEEMSVRTIQSTSEERICGVLGVHPVIVGLGAGSAQSRVGAATKELERAAWTNRIIPLQNTIAQQIARQLLPNYLEDQDNLEEWDLQWNRSQVLSLQPDLLREAQRWAILGRAGLAQRYDARVSMSLPTDDSDRVYLIPTNLTPVPAGQLPPPAEAVADDPETESGEEAAERDNRTWVLKALDKIAGTKATLTDRQRAVLRALTRDYDDLVREFTGELQEALDELGRLAEEAFLVSVEAENILNGSSRAKQTDAEINRQVNRVMAALNIEAWEQQTLAPAWDGSTLRTIQTTVGTLNGTLGLNVSLPDPLQREILAAGGTRRGLIDFTAQARESLFRTIHAGRSEGIGPRALGRRIRAQVPAGRFVNAGSVYRSELIARTETSFAQNDSAIATYTEADGIDQIQIVDAQLGDETDDACVQIDGLVVSIEEAQSIDRLQHPACTRDFLPYFEDDD